MEFPQYRKLSNNKSFYRIDAPDRFVEIQIIGSKTFVHDVNATQYPEKLRIMEMLDYSLDGIESVEASLFTELMIHAIKV